MEISVHDLALDELTQGFLGIGQMLRWKSPLPRQRLPESDEAAGMFGQFVRRIGVG